MAEKQAISVNLPAELVERVDGFCDERVLGRAKFVEIACERLLATAPRLPGFVEERDGRGRLVATYMYGDEDEGPGTLDGAGFGAPAGFGARVEDRFAGLSDDSAPDEAGV